MHFGAPCMVKHSQYVFMEYAAFPANFNVRRYMLTHFKSSPHVHIWRRISGASCNAPEHFGALPVAFTEMLHIRQCIFGTTARHHCRDYNRLHTEKGKQETTRCAWNLIHRLPFFLTEMPLICILESHTTCTQAPVSLHIMGRKANR